jgi:predicted RNA binding protein YcfA (HicA-like mRNA interferase family)
LRHQTRRLTVTVPMHTGSGIGRGLAVRLLKDAGFTVEEYLRLR